MIPSGTGRCTCAKRVVCFQYGAGNNSTNTLFVRLWHLSLLLPRHSMVHSLDESDDGLVSWWIGEQSVFFRQIHSMLIFMLRSHS